MKQEFLDRMQELLKDDYEMFLKSYQNKVDKSFMLNTSKVNEKDFLKQIDFEVEKINKIENAYFYKEDSLGNHPYHHAGLFYIQEPSAMLPPLSIDIKNDFKILDLCAAPGGKTSILANQAYNGTVLANEVNYNRCKKLLSNVERLGLKNVIVSNMEVSELTKIYQNYFDVVLLDAPCSGEGMFRKDSKAIKEWSLEKVNDLSSLQKSLIEKASSLVKTNGYLIYSTCTFSKEEDEYIICDFLKNHDFTLEDVKEFIKPISKEGFKLEKTRRCYPYIFGEGQFIAVLKNNEIKPPIFKGHPLEDLNNEESKIVSEFIKNELTSSPFIVKKYHNNIIVLNENTNILEGSIISCFVKLGDIKNQRLIPHHQFVKAYGNLFINTLSLEKNDERINKYLKGEEIKAQTKDGYGVLLVDNYPLGLYKASNGRLKNHYPKGLRLNNN